MSDGPAETQGAVAPAGDLAAEVAARDWYHTIELAPGVVTPGWFDTRKVAPKLPWPTLEGLRCLDVGTFDGFWAFEMERRGASEVVAIDILDPNQWDWPALSEDELTEVMGKRKGAGEGFEIAKAALGSSVERHELSIYDLDPEKVGTFDFVYVGSLLLHLRDPVRGLEAVRAVCTGRLLAVDAIDIGLTVRQPKQPVAHLDGVGRPWWWKPNLAAMRHMVAVAGFRVDSSPPPFVMPPGPGHPQPKMSRRLVANRAGRELALASRLGDPHAAVLATPRTES